MELSDISGVGPSRADDLEELGYDSVEAVAEADPEDLTELARVGEDKALEMIVDAQNLVEDAESDEEEDSITFDEDDLEDEEEVEEVAEVEEEVEEVEDVEEVEEDAEDALYEVSLDLNDVQKDVIVTAMMDSHTSLRSNHRARSQACGSFLEKFREGASMELTEAELNALHAAIRQRRLDYQGNNHMDLMHETMDVENQVKDARQEHLF